MRRIVAGLACATLASGTGSRGASAQDRTVRADGPPVWGEMPALVEEVRIGLLEGPPEYLFGQVSGLAALADGSIWVGDDHLHAIRRYAADGAYQGQVGREGEGPGEFDTPTTIRVLSDGSVAVFDPRLRRISHFEADGTFLDSFAPPTNGIYGGVVGDLGVDGEGRFTVAAMKPPAPGQPRTAMSVVWLLLDRAGAVLDTLRLEPTEPVGSSDPIRTLTRRSPLGYLVTGRTDRYALTLQLGPGEARTIERAWEPVRYASEERAERERLEEVIEGRSGRPGRDIPRTKLPWKDLWIDGAGRLWVRMYAEGYRHEETPGEEASRREACAFFGASDEECDRGVDAWREPVVFEVIEPDGRYLGRVRLPAADAVPKQAEGAHLWVVEEGDFGEQSVVRYRIDAGGPR